MPDTPGKRQRDTAKINRRRVKEERRAARKAARDDPPPVADDEQAEDQAVDTGGQPDGDGEPRD